MDWIDDEDGTRGAKRHPEFRPAAHEVHRSLRAADDRPVEEAFTDPFDPAPVQTSAVSNVGDDIDLAEKLLPELLDEIDHAGLVDFAPDDHPGDATADPLKGLPAAWRINLP